MGPKTHALQVEVGSISDIYEVCEISRIYVAYEVCEVYVFWGAIMVDQVHKVQINWGNFENSYEKLALIFFLEN